MVKKCRLMKLISFMLLCTFLTTVPAFAIDPIESKVSSMSNKEIAEEYHRHFHLFDTQKQELADRGYSEKEIAKLDREDFNKIEQTWLLSEKQIYHIKRTFPELDNVDISGWTNADAEAYYRSIERSTPVPTAEQKAKLKEKGIPLSVASQMLRNYIDYETLLSRSDAELNNFKELIVETIQKSNEFKEYKKALKKKYLESLVGGE